MRRSINSEVLDLDHFTYYVNKMFHSEFKQRCVCVACLQPIFAYRKYTCKTKKLKVMLTPLKSPDKYLKYSDESQHQKVEIERRLQPSSYIIYHLYDIWLLHIKFIIVMKLAM